MDLSDTALRAALLAKLARRRCWHNKHSSFEDVVKRGFKPKHHNRLKHIVQELIKENLLLCWHTGYGKRISLNPEKAHEIKTAIDAEDY